MFSKLDWGSYIISIAKTACKGIRILIRSMEFLSLEVALYIYLLSVEFFNLFLLLLLVTPCFVVAIQPCME